MTRHYTEGEKLSYHMKATNQDRHGTLRYEIQADGVVKKKCWPANSWKNLAGPIWW